LLTFCRNEFFKKEIVMSIDRKTSASRRDVIAGSAGAVVAAAAIGGASAAPAHKPNAKRTELAMTRMQSGFVTTKDGVEIFYKDWGSGQPIVFSHGWPLSADDWDAQMMFFLQHGYRVIAHDRRGHGRSTQTDTGNDMDH
jgi:non-heme chloroperoxidase